jgi:hypothetical protein
MTRKLTLFFNFKKNKTPPTQSSPVGILCARVGDKAEKLLLNISLQI